MQVRNCPDCRGTGETREDCIWCHGSGLGFCEKCEDYIQSDHCNFDLVEQFNPPGRDFSMAKYTNCRKCNGTGMTQCDTCFGKKYDKSSCCSCDGSGQVTFEEYERILSYNLEISRQEREARKAESEAKELREASYSSYSGAATKRPMSTTATVTLMSVTGALFTWLGWLGVVGSATFSLLWFLSVILGIVGIVLLIPLAGIIICIVLALAVIAIALGLVYLIVMLIINIIKYFASNLS